MTFTYAGTLSTDLDKCRFYLQDSVSGSGPKPADANFSDEELTGLITAEGSWQRAVAAGFDVLCAAWRRYPTFQTEGLRLDRSAIADGFAEQAKQWRARFGNTTTASTGRAGSRASTRVDGYSSDVASDEA